MDAENVSNGGCSQKDSAEHKRYVRAHRSFKRIWKERNSAEPDILGRILAKDNLNRAYKRVRANKGAPGVDGMTIEEALPWLKEHGNELIDRIRSGARGEAVELDGFPFSKRIFRLLVQHFHRHLAVIL